MLRLCQKLLSVMAVLMLYALALPGPCAAGDSSGVRLTFKNTTTQNVLVAIIYAGFDMGDDRKVGWYAVDSGATRTVALPDKIHPSLTMEGTGYYAKSQPRPGQKTLYWSGDFKKLSVTSQRFNAPQHEELKNGWAAGFRRIKLVRKNSDLATATITLKE